MAAAGSEALSGRYQFRLDIKDPRQMELALQLQELEGGQRNRFIVERLLAPETGGIKEALREVLREFSAVSPAPPSTVETGQPPDDLFDTSLFT